MERRTPRHRAPGLTESNGQQANEVGATTPGPANHPEKRSLVILIVIMATAGAAFHVGVLHASPPVGPPYELPWWILALGFAATGIFVIHFQVRRDAHSITLSELPLVIGLGLASPLALVVGRLVGSGAALVLYRRQRPMKLAFNLALFYLETTMAIGVYRWILGLDSSDSPRGWVAALAAVLVVLVAGWAFVSLAISIHDRRRPLGATVRTLLVSSVASFGSALVALLFLIVLWKDRRAFVIVLVLAAVLYLFVRAFGSMSRRYQDLQSVYSFAREVDRPVSGDQLLAMGLARVRDLLRADLAEVAFTFDREDGAGVRMTMSQAGEIERTPMNKAEIESLIDDVWEDGSRRFAATKGDRRLLAHYQQRGFESGIVVPLLSPDEVVGVLAAGNRLGPVPAFDADDVGLLELLAKHTGITLQRNRLIQSLKDEAGRRKYQALHDELTGLPNRLHFTNTLGRQLEKVKEGRSQAAVLLIDLDRFKEVNDTLGHHYGDVLLQEVGHRLQGELGPGNPVARFGGDEFAVLLVDPGTVADVVETTARLGSRLARPFPLAGLSLEVPGSIGVAIAPDHGRDAASLLQHADVAMNAAKDSGSAYEIYSPGRDDHSPGRLALAGELRTAITDGELEVHYQPKVRLTDHRVIGFEALARWPRSGLQQVLTEEFIAIAERTGLIRALTSRVMGTALADVAAWRRVGHDLGIAVNVSARSVLDGEFPSVVGAALEESQVHPSLLTLEITETSIMTDSPRAAAALKELSAIGVQLSIDDFGTGYSSLSYLRRLPVHEVKVDRSFITQLALDDGNALIVRSIIELAHGLGMRVVAEGVENQLSWNLLVDMGCDVAQGFYVCRPLPAASVKRWLPDPSDSGGMEPPGEGRVAYMQTRRANASSR